MSIGGHVEPLIMSLLKIGPMSPRSIEMALRSIGLGSSFVLIQRLTKEGKVRVNRDFKIEIC
jgi:hypothetical protein